MGLWVFYVNEQVSYIAKSGFVPAFRAQQTSFVLSKLIYYL